MLTFVHICMVLIVLFIDILVVLELKGKGQFFSPYMFFFIMISVELLGPLVYYYILEGSTYRMFSDESLRIYYYIALFSSCVFYFQIKSRKRVKFKEPRTYKVSNKERVFHFYMVAVLIIVAFYIIRYRNQLLLLNVLQGNTETLVRSDTSGLIPHWYTISTLISLVIPSFYFYYSKSIKSQFISFLLFFSVAFLTIIDGNKGVFVYLILFLFMYVYRFRVNKYVVLSVVMAFAFYYLLKAGSVSQLGVIIGSAFRRFFVTQGACFINRIQMVADNYDFSNTDRISNDVFLYIYHYSGGAAPTVFWGDIYVKYGLVVTLVVIVISNWILYRSSEFIFNVFNDDRFMYWSFAIVSFLLCTSELSLDHLLRFMIVALNCVVFLLTVGNKNEVEVTMLKNSSLKE